MQNKEARQDVDKRRPIASHNNNNKGDVSGMKTRRGAGGATWWRILPWICCQFQKLYLASHGSAAVNHGHLFTPKH